MTFSFRCTLHPTYLSARPAARHAMTDALQPLSAMAAVTKNLCFAVTASTSFESPFLLAKRFSTLDHLTDGRFGWNIVTSSHKKSVFKALGSTREIEHDERYDQADEFVRLMYKLWEGSWAEDAVVRQADADVYARPELIRKIVHDGKYFHLDTRHIVECAAPSSALLVLFVDVRQALAPAHPSAVPGGHVRGGLEIRSCSRRGRVCCCSLAGADTAQDCRTAPDGCRAWVCSM